MSVGIGRKSFIEFGSSVPITILNDYDNMSLMYGFSNPSYYTLNGNNLSTPFVKDRSFSDTTFVQNIGAVPFDAAKKAAKYTSSGFLTHYDIPFLKANTLIAIAFRLKFEFSTNGSIGSIRLLYKDNSMHFAFIDAQSYQDTSFDAITAVATKGHCVYELNGHTIIFLYSDGTTVYYYINNVLIQSHTFTGNASDIILHSGIFPLANNYPLGTELYMHEMRVYNKIYTSDERTTLYNYLKNTYNLDDTNYPTLTNLVINGTVAVGNTVTLSYTYNQNGASAAGDFYVLSGWYYNNSLTGVWALRELISRNWKKNDLTAVVPSATVGYYFYMIVIAFDDQGRCQKTAVKSSAIITA